jgi:hypothetical protein
VFVFGSVCPEYSAFKKLNEVWANFFGEFKFHA